MLHLASTSKKRKWTHMVKNKEVYGKIIEHEGILEVVAGLQFEETIRTQIPLQSNHNI